MNLMRMYLVLWAVPALRPPSARGLHDRNLHPGHSPRLDRGPLEFLQTMEVEQPEQEPEVPTGFLARTKLVSHPAEVAGIDEAAGVPTGRVADLKGGAARLRLHISRSALLHAREILAALCLVVAAVSAGRREPAEAAIAEEPATQPLLALQVGSALCALVGQAVLPSPAVLILADATAHTALLLRGVLGFVEAKHGVAVQQYRRRLVGWSVWLDLRAHLPAVAAVVAWSTSSLAFVLFVLVSMGRRQLFPWAWWASHAVLSAAVLGLAVSTENRHPAQPPRVWLLCNCLVGCVYGGPFTPPADFVLVVVPLLQLLEAVRALRHRGERACDVATESRSYDCRESPSLERQLVATLQGNQDTGEFEQHLAAERRLCELYCFQDLLTCEGAPSAPELLDRYRTWSAQFVADRAPLAVRHLPALDDPQRVELCPQASVHRAKQALLSTLRAPYARFLARKRRMHLSAGRPEVKPPSRLSLRTLLPGYYKPEPGPTVV